MEEPERCAVTNSGQVAIAFPGWGRGAHAVQHALLLAAERQVGVIAIHALDSADLPGSIDAPDWAVRADASMARLDDEARRLLDRAEVTWTLSLVRGVPGRSVVRAALEYAASALVVAADDPHATGILRAARHLPEARLPVVLVSASPAPQLIHG